MFRTLINTIGALLPSWSPVDFGAIAAPITSLFASQPLRDLLAWINFYVPLREGVSAALVLVGLYVGVLAYKTIVWVLTKAHVLGGSSE
jgi:hypothetical protein